MTPDDRDGLAELDLRLVTLLPEGYRETYETLAPVSMGSAGLKYDDEGRVAWDQVWGSFCHLAMAGGPPHRGTFLAPGTAADIAARPEAHDAVLAELARGIGLVTDLGAYPAPRAGWIRVDCFTQAMAGWLARAIVMENVAAHPDGLALDLPAGPDFRVAKEIKNVITAIAKTHHYWSGHMSRAQRLSIGSLLTHMASESPFVEPELDAAEQSEPLAAAIAARIEEITGLVRSRPGSTGWLGLECSNVHAALWMMRAMVTANVLARREETTLFVAVNPLTDPSGDLVVNAVTRIQRLARAAGVL